MGTTCHVLNSTEDLQIGDNQAGLTSRYRTYHYVCETTRNIYAPAIWELLIARYDGRLGYKLFQASCLATSLALLVSSLIHDKRTARLS